MIEYQDIIDKYYPAGTFRRDIYMRHCRSVADEALMLAHRCRLELDCAMVESAAMLHDIGICLTYAPSIGCDGAELYICHGVLGAELLRKEGADDVMARVAERHTGSGLTAAEIRLQNLPLPHRDFMPETVLERLICYADKFYSKGNDMKRKPLEKVRASLSRFGADSLARFDAMHHEFTA